MKETENDIRMRIERLRELMRGQGLAAYIIPTTDFHGSEYVNDYFKAREFMSGFTGSAGTLVVTLDEAALWTDGRYFLQAGQQLSGSGIRLMRQGEDGVPEIIPWLEQKLDSKSTVGFDGRIASAEFGAKVADKFAVKADLDLVSEIWEDRPELTGSHVYALDESLTGESATSKLARVRVEMKKLGADAHIITCLEEIAWMLNLRGRDIEHTPVFYAFMLVLPETVRLYALAPETEIREALGKESSQQTGGLQDVEILPYFDVFDDMKRLGDFGVHRILMDEKKASYSLISAVPEGVEIENHEDPAILMKAIKNPVEIENTRQAHIRDGVAVTQFIRWVKEAVQGEAREARVGAAPALVDSVAGGAQAASPLTEMDAAQQLSELRREQGAYDDSFNTIAGYGEHGAIVHYGATPETDVELEPHGLLLVDSGGQYNGGTTDITRTIALGPLTDEMKKCYTIVLKAHIALAMSKFTEDVTGAELDEIPHGKVKEYGYDYNHGTGHGVGHMLSVHEGPNSINPRGKNSHLFPGMITSNEPGIYLEGKFGIRLENETLCVFADDGKFGFETITFAPFEREAIVIEMLTAEERTWLNSYHAQVYEKLSPLLDPETRDWLRAVTEEL